MEIKQQVANSANELVSLYRDFHTHPELGFKEYRSQKKIIDYFTNLGLKPRKIASTGVVAELKGTKPGKTVLLRSDMDALPVTEETGLSFASETFGIMHACGHDGHMAMLMVAAKMLTAMKDEIPGTIKFLFQPNEEDAGAHKVVKEGVMHSPEVDSVFGLHLWSQCPLGQIDIVDGPQMAASYYFNLKIKGHGGHAGFAHESTDPVFISSLIIQAVQGIQTREVNALDPAVIMFTQMNAGTSTTTIPEAAELTGSIRFLYADGKSLFKRFEHVISHICAAYGAEYELEFKKGNALLSNHPETAALVRTAAAEVVGPEQVTTKIRTMAGEDFSEYLAHATGTFAFVGFNNSKKGIVYPHHHPKFTIDEDALVIGTELHIRAALKLLKG
ncbi:amidohydrolase [uncultured Desulfuromusa sp.]|uniref:M20 metallopeptidase family protein n=1 Tax=uncultured Desulfuromusa sp. TaxID=219183 RepID=UPI002AA7F44E|nr:amidohydrolase [uncultured Desulfuromusa sp.]